MAALLLFFALAIAQPAPAEAVKGYSRRHNTTFLKLESGTAELEWITTSTFRFLRCPVGACASRRGVDEAVAFTVREDRQAVEWRSIYLVVRVAKATGRLEVRTAQGDVHLEELAGGSLFARRALTGERLYGLGPHEGVELDLRGTKQRSTRPLLVSSGGFGQYFSAPAEYEFDLGATNRDEIRVGAPFGRYLEFFYYYGPAPKEILEEHRNVGGVMGAPRLEHLRILRPEEVPDYGTRLRSAPQIAHASFSHILAPAFEVEAVSGLRLAPWLPLLYSADGGAPDALLRDRRRFAPYLYTYLQEARDRGLPVLRPLAMQFSKDGEAVRHGSQLMAGDELLIAEKDSLYLPMGEWTDLCSNQRYKGRREISVEAGGCGVLARNGSIVPIDTGARMELHYYPRLGAEFFLSEPGGGYSQFHAGPAGDYLRLEIESEVSRDYEWVVHHVSEAETVSTGVEARHDAEKKNVHVRVHGGAGADVIVNLRLREPL